MSTRYYSEKILNIYDINKELRTKFPKGIPYVITQKGCKLNFDTSYPSGYAVFAQDNVRLNEGYELYVDNVTLSEKMSKELIKSLEMCIITFNTRRHFEGTFKLYITLDGKVVRDTYIDL